MSKKTREEILIERINKAGIKPAVDQTNAPFKFLISPVATVGVEVRLVSLGFMQECFKLVERTSFISPISGIVFFPKILDPRIIKSKDVLSHKRAHKSIYVGVNIPFNKWMTASPSMRLHLFAENLIASIDRISSKYLYPEDRRNLLETVKKAEEILKSKHLN